MTKRQDKLFWLALAGVWFFVGWTLLRAILYGVLPARSGGGVFTFAESPFAFVLAGMIFTAIFIAIPAISVGARKQDRQIAAHARRWRPPLDKGVRRSEEER